MGEHPLDLEKTGSRSILVVGNTPSLTTDEPFRAKLAPSRPKLAPRRPQEASQEVLGKFVFFFQKKKLVGPGTQSNLLAVTRCRFAAAGDGSALVIRCLETRKNGYYGGL